MIITNGIVITVDDANPEAEAIAIKAGKIIAVGLNEDIMKYQDNMTNVIDAKENLVIPGLIEGHGHFMSTGSSKLNVNLMKIKTWEEGVQLVTEAVKNAKPGELIEGRGWHQEKWDKLPDDHFSGLPTYEALSKISPNNPVILNHASGHSSIANKKAFELAGISKSTKNPEGGKIIKNKKGEPIGVLLEEAMSLMDDMRDEIKKNQTEESKKERKFKEIEVANQTALENGITSFHDAGEDFVNIKLFMEMIDAGKLDVRLYVMLSDKLEDIVKNKDTYRFIGYGNNMLTVRSIKRSIDGALGSHGAWLIENYSDAEKAQLEEPAGLNTTSLEEMNAVAKFAIGEWFPIQYTWNRRSRKSRNFRYL